MAFIPKTSICAGLAALALTVPALAGSAAAQTGAPASASNDVSAANADGAAYGEPASSGGCSGRTCHHDWPAAASQSTNR